MRFQGVSLNMENIILFDWVTFTTKDLDFDHLLELVGLESQNLPWELLNGHNNYKSRYHYGGISINFDGRLKADKNGMPVEMGICFEMSGTVNREANNLSYKELIAKHPIGRLGKPEEIAHAIIFLCENDFVTGTSLIVDGGYTAR